MSPRFPIMNLEGPSEVTLSLEQRFQICSNILVHQFFQTYRLIGERYGWEAANEIAAEVPAPSVPLLVEGYRKKFGLEAEGAALLAQVMAAEFQGEGSDVAVIDENEEEATFEVLCTFGAQLTSERYADVKIEDGLCNLGCEGFMCDVGATMDPPVRAERLAWMGDGAPRCRFAVRREAGRQGEGTGNG